MYQKQKNEHGEENSPHRDTPESFCRPRNRITQG